LRAAVHADLVEQAQGVGLDGAGGDAERGGDVGRPQAADDQLEHPRLGGPQLVEQLQRLHRQIELAAGLGHEHRRHGGKAARRLVPAERQHMHHRFAAVAEACRDAAAPLQAGAAAGGGRYGGGELAAHQLPRQVQAAGGAHQGIAGGEHRLGPLVGVDDTQLFVDEDDARAERGEGGLERCRRLLAAVEQAADDGGAAQMRRQHAQAFDLGIADGRRRVMHREGDVGQQRGLNSSTRASWSTSPCGRDQFS